MPDSIDANTLTNIIELVVVFVVIGSVIWRRSQRNTPSADSTGASLIISMFSLGTTLNKLGGGTAAGYKYSLTITEPNVREAFLPGVNSQDTRKYYSTGEKLAGRIIMIMDLPYKSPVHVAGFGLQDKSFVEALGNTSVDNSMKRVELEGDFPDYFRLYCEPDHEIELREVLDPTLMEFLVDYCKKMQWEVLDNNIYFAQSEKPVGKGNSESIVGDAEEFTARVLPVLQRANFGQSHSQ